MACEAAPPAEVEPLCCGGRVMKACETAPPVDNKRASAHMQYSLHACLNAHLDLGALITNGVAGYALFYDLLVLAPAFAEQIETPQHRQLPCHSKLAVRLPAQPHGLFLHEYFASPSTPSLRAFRPLQELIDVHADRPTSLRCYFTFHSLALSPPRPIMMQVRSSSGPSAP